MTSEKDTGAGLKEVGRPESASGVLGLTELIKNHRHFLAFPAGEDKSQVVGLSLNFLQKLSA